MKIFRVGIGQISVEFGQAQRLAGFQIQGLVGLGFRDWLFFSAQELAGFCAELVKGRVSWLWFQGQ